MLHANQSGVEEIESLVTHTSIVRAVVDYVLRALDGRGTIEIADAPLQKCDFEQVVRRTMIDQLLDRYRSRFPQVRFAIVDLRKTILHSHRARDRRAQQSGDPRGYTLIDVGQQSLLTDIEHRYRRFCVANYDHRMMAAHHNRQLHEYLVANSVLSADFIINVPKLKCHIKAGITGPLKKLVGINGHKEFLPHHVNGCPATGGDQYPARSRILPLANRVYDDYWARLGERAGARNLAQALAVRLLRKGARVLDHAGMFDGGWSGNDTIPRTTLDLNHVLYFYNPGSGGWSPTPVRTVLADRRRGDRRPGLRSAPPDPQRVKAWCWEDESLDGEYLRRLAHRSRALQGAAVALCHYPCAKPSGKRPDGASRCARARPGTVNVGRSAAQPRVQHSARLGGRRAMTAKLLQRAA